MPPLSTERGIEMAAADSNGTAFAHFCNKIGTKRPFG
jgi:hypothetical protein